jgi:hypothetical protein
VTALAAETVPTVQVAVLSPRAQPLLKAGFWLDGAAVRATDTPVAEPPLTETETENPAVCPRAMLACARWTLTQSSAAAAEALLLGFGLALGLADVLALALGLVLMYALRTAETVADGRDDPDGDVEGEGSSVLPDGLADGDGDPVPDFAGDGDEDAVRDGDGDALRDGDGDGLREGDGEGDVVRDGEGEGDGEPLAGRGRQVASVFADDVEVVPGRSEPARAMTGQLASTPTIRQRPASMLSVDTRTCANRI